MEGMKKQRLIHAFCLLAFVFLQLKSGVFSDKSCENVIKRLREIIHNSLHDAWGLKRRPMETDVKGKYRTKLRKIIGSKKHCEKNNMKASVLVSIFKFSTFWYLWKQSNNETSLKKLPQVLTGNISAFK